MDLNGVILFTSTQAGNPKVLSNTSTAELILKGNGIEYRKIDVTDPDNAEYKQYIRDKSEGKLVFPSIYVNGNFRGFFDDLEEANEDGTVREFLGV